MFIIYKTPKGDRGERKRKMNNLFKKIATALVGMAMAIGVSVAVGKSVQVAKADYYGQTALSALATGDVGVLVGNNGSNYAMGNTGGTSNAPSAVAVTIADGKLTSTVTASILWEVTNNNGSLQFKVPGSSNYLYSTNSNNGLRVGTNANNVFVLDSNYLKNSATSRYVGVYNSADWRCYTSINSNIENQTFAFYKLVEESGGDPIPVTGVTLDKESFNIEVNEELTLSASVVPVNADVKTVSWTSSDPAVASVTDAGVVKGLKVGTTTITATTTEENNTAHGDCVINVKEWNYGSESQPLTVSQAKAVLNEVGNKVVTLSKMYVTGIVGTSEEQASGKDYRNVWLQSEDGSTEKAFELFSTKIDSSITGISSAVDALKGYTVVAHGWGELYNTTYELTNKARGSNDYDNPMIISAVAPIVKHEVSFAANGGTGEKAAVEVNDGDTYELPANPFTAPQGQEFEGWKVGNETTIRQPGYEITIDGDVVITAQWKDIVVYQTVTLKAGDGTGEDIVNSQVVKGSTFELPACSFTAPDADHEFAGWKVGNDSTLRAAGYEFTVDADIEIVAQWKEIQQQQAPTPASLVVTYQGNNPKVGEVLPGEMIVKIKYSDDSVGTDDIADECQYYILVNNQEQAVGEQTTFDAAGEVTVYARYTGNLTAPITGSVVITVDPAPAQTVEFDVTFDYATEGKANGVVKVEENQKVTKPDDPTKEGYDFAGWYLGNDLYDFNTPVTQAITLVAHWTEKQQETVNSPVEFVPTDFGTTAGEQSVTHEKITLTLEQGCQNANNGDFRIYANKKLTVAAASGYEIYKIEFDGTGVETGKTPANLTTVSGAYAYANDKGTWSGRAASIEFSGTAQSRIKSAKVYFVVEGGEIPTPAAPTEYTIHFVGGEGSQGTMADVKVEEGTQYAAPECTFTAPSGKVFDKWVDASGAAITFPLTINADVTLYASWKDATTPVDPGTDPQPTEGKVDTINAAFVAQPSTTEDHYSYYSWSGKEATSGAVFAGDTAAGSQSTNTMGTVIQLRNGGSTNHPAKSGIVTTQGCGLKVASVTIDFNAASAEGRTVQVYGKTSAYTSPEDLYGDAKGTLLGEITATASKLTVEGEYQYIGLMSKSGAIYINSIKICWGVDDGQTPVNPDPGTDPGTTPTGHGYAANDPFTVAEALELLSTLGTNKSEQLYVRGKISSIKEVSPKVGEEGYGNATFNISVDGSETAAQLTVFRCKYLENADFTAQDQIKVGDDVTIVGQLKNYVKDNVTTPEFDAGCYIQAFNTGSTPVDPGTQPGGEGGEQGGNTPAAVTLVKIDVTGFDTVNYVKGQALDLSGIKVYLHYSDGSVVEAKAEEFTVSGYDPNKLGQQTITVTAGGMTWKVNVIVTDAMGCHGSIVAGSALISLTTLLGAGLLMLKKRKQD